jgi:hypothetical protein
MPPGTGRIRKNRSDDEMDTKQPPLLMPYPEARKALGGIGNTKLWELIEARQLERVRIGTRAFVTAESVAAYVERLKGQGDSQEATA